MACLQFERFGIDRVQVPLAVSYVDHNVVQFDSKNPEDHAYLSSFAARYGLLYSRPGNGISHYLHLERFARPGQFLLGADSHTTMAGALGMLAVGAGATEVAVVMAGRPYPLERPRVVGVRLEGRLGPWVQSKDIVLELLRRRGVRGGRGCAFEFYGEGVATLSATDRGTICNMVMETGATTGIFPSDEQTRSWLAAQGREEQWLELAADPGVRYDDVEVVELDELEPLIALPSSPGNVVPVREVRTTPARQVCVGSSVNSSFEDLAIVAAVLREHVVSPQLDLTVTPGSRQILDLAVRSGVYSELLAAGARIPRARVRALYRDDGGARSRSGLGSHVQPKLPRPQRHRGRPGVPLLAGDGGRHRAVRRDHGPARAGTTAAALADAVAGPVAGRPSDRSAALSGGGSPRRAREGAQHRPASARAATAGDDRRPGADRRPGRCLHRRHGTGRGARRRYLVEHPGLRQIHVPPLRSRVSRSSTRSRAAGSSSAATTTARDRAASKRRSRRSTSACGPSSRRVSLASTAPTSSHRAFRHSCLLTRLITNGPSGRRRGVFPASPRQCARADGSSRPRRRPGRSGSSSSSATASAPSSSPEASSPTRRQAE